MGSRYMIRYLIMMTVLLIGAGSSLGQSANPNYDYLGTPVYYSNTQHLPGMPVSPPNYVAPYGSNYYGYYGPYPYNNYYSNYYNNFGYAPGYMTGFGLTGRVTDQSGNGIAGAQVILTNVYDVGSFSTTTNSLGYYGINAPDGVYYVTASLPGYSFTQQVGRLVSGFISPALNIVGTPTSGAMAAPSYSAQYGMPATSSTAAYSTPAASSAQYGTPAAASSSTGYSSGSGSY